MSPLFLKSFRYKRSEPRRYSYDHMFNFFFSLSLPRRCKLTAVTVAPGRVTSRLHLCKPQYLASLPPALPLSPPSTSPPHVIPEMGV